MSLPATDPTAPPAHTPRRSLLAAAGWALACAACAGGVWAAGLVANLTLLGATLSIERLAGLAVVAALGLAVGGAVSGLAVGALVGLARRRPRRAKTTSAVLTGVLVGTVGGGLSVPVMLACAWWMHPLLSSSLLWALIGLFVGMAEYNWSHRTAKGPTAEDEYTPPTRQPFGSLAAAEWALASAVCTGGLWAGVLVAAKVFLGVDFPPDVHAAEGIAFPLMFAALGTGCGALGGAIVGVCRRSGERLAATRALFVGGALFGAFCGALSILAVPAARGHLPPLASSSLAVAVVGFFAGLCGYEWSQRAAPAAEPPVYEEEADRPAGVKVEWLLRETKRPWRIDRALGRVLPVLAVAVAALAGAAVLAPADVALALLAVGLLGLAVAFVLYRQEKRLDALERRLREREWPGAHGVPAAAAGSRVRASSNSSDSAAVTAPGASTGEE